MKSFITSGASCYVKLYIALVAILFDNFGSGSYEEHLCEII